MDIRRFFGLIALCVSVAACNAQQTPAATSPMAQKKAPVSATSRVEDKDEITCTGKGFAPQTERYYQCRAELIRNRAGKSQFGDKALEEQAESFETKAKESYKQQINTISSARKAWENEQSKRIVANEAKDHQACLAKGFTPGKPENPNTEAYYDCRAVQAAQRVSPPPAETGYDRKQLPQSVLEFYRQAEEAKQAFDTRDYQDHYTCLDKNLFPGEWANPNTAEYYRCRAALAENGLGKDVKALFLQDVAHAMKEQEGNRACTARHYAPGSQEYVSCRKAYASYKQCKANIASEVAKKAAEDQRTCGNQANLLYPSRLTQKRVIEATNVDVRGEEVRTYSVENARYTPKELEDLRKSTTSSCIQDKEATRLQYRLQLENRCEKIMDDAAMGVSR